MSKRVNLKAIHFDGDAGVNIANSDLVIMSDQDVFTWSDSTSLATGENHKPFTMSSWINPSLVSNSNYGTIIGKFSQGGAVDPGNNATEWLFMILNNGKIHFALYDTVFHHTVNKITTTSTGRFVSANQWQHVAVTFNGDPQNFSAAAETAGLTPDLGLTIYYNGQAVPHVDDLVHHPSSDGYVITRNTKGVVAIGGFHWDSTSAPDSFNSLFEGKIADTCIFNKELSAAEVQEIYNNGKVKDMTKHSAYDYLISWWKMGDDLDQSGTNGIIDYVSGFHGSLHGQAFIETDPSLPTDRIGNSGVAVPSSWGRTRAPKNVAGDQQVYIHGGISGDMPTADPSSSADGYTVENQRYIHLYWKAASTTTTVTAWGYSHASGQWSELFDTNGTQIQLPTTAAEIDTYRIFEIAGVDKVYFKQSGDPLASTDLFAAAASTF